MDVSLAKQILRHCGWGVLAVAAVTGLALMLRTVTGYWAISLVYLLTVVFLALKLNRWAVLLAAALSAVLWDFLFIPPQFTFHIEATEDVMMFSMYFVVALVMGHMTNQLRRREESERRREQRTAALNRLLQGLAVSDSLADGLARAVEEVNALFQVQTRILLEETAPTTSLCLPLQTANGRVGWMGVELKGNRVLAPSECELLETFASQIAAFVERQQLLAVARQTQLAQESERLHRTLLDSVSHELKTPLAVIRTATDGLATQLADGAPPLAGTFLNEITAANRRLERIVSNLLDMTRIESGQLPFRPEWCDVRDLLESAVEQLQNEISPERVNITVADGLPLVQLDFGLMEQALCNLLLNAAQHSPARSLIRLSAEIREGQLVLRVTDAGSGLTPGEETKVFDKFYRGKGARSGGVGLGLSIVKGFVNAHRGVVSATNNLGEGVTFTIFIPLAT